MSDEQRRDDEVEVEGHSLELSVNEEPAEEGESEVEAHVMRTASVRMEAPRNT
jgi:hypothetical protein